MKKGLSAAIVVVLGGAFLVLALATGCGWRVEGEGFRVGPGGEEPGESSYGSP